MNKYYQTDKRCLRCGGTERYVANNNCVACAKEATKTYYKANKGKANKRTLAWCHANPNKRQAINRRHKYGVEPTAVAKRLEAQHHKCAICLCVITAAKHQSNEPYACVDHNHETGEIRGLLCPSCNHGLGKFQDNSTHLRRAANYLETHTLGDL